MRDSVPSGSYSSVCNVLRQWQSRSSLLIESTDSMIIIFIIITSAGDFLDEVSILPFARTKLITEFYPVLFFQFP